jgi:hypothetical protein
MNKHTQNLVPASQEDKKEAVNIGVNLSNQLIATSLTLIAVVGAISTFILQARVVSIWFYLFATVSFLFLLLSIYSGGKGINKARNAGYNGDWSLKVSGSFFNRQAIMTGLGVLCFCSMFFFGHDKDSKLEKSAIETNQLLVKQVELTNQMFDRMTKEQAQQINLLIIKVDSLQDKIAEIKK